MPAPAEFAQIIVIGLQAEVWLALLLITLFGPWRWPLGIPEGIAILAVTAVAIVLGVLVDRLADSAFGALRRWRRAKPLLAAARVHIEDSPKWVINMMRHRTMESDDPRGRFLEYQRNRHRIARATAFNLVVLAVPAGFFMALRTDVGPGVIVGSEILILLGAGLSLFAAARIGAAWFGALSEAYRQWAEDHPERAASDMDPDSPPPSVDPKCIRAAAVCYQLSARIPRFLVVKTTDGRFWTVPKGHVRRGEARSKAASREAKEEAGVDGEVSESAFTWYRYPGDARPCSEVSVGAHLLRVEHEGEPDPKERHRERAWLDPGKAKEHLAAGRSLRYALEHVRLIDEAQREIERERRGSFGRWLKRLWTRLRGATSPVD